MNVNEQQVFLDGYDVVSYFTAGTPVQGSPEHSAELQGATFHFSSEANRAAFVKEPAKYLPKYGGFCAFAVANGKFGVKPDPNTFKLHNGELLLFFNDVYEGKPFNTKIPWEQNEREISRKAEDNWQK